MDRRDFLKTVAITGAALSIQHSEAMEILTQTINNTNGGNPDLVAVMVENRKLCSAVLSANWAV